jgi:Protein of Unknown function (DUF1690)
VERALERENLDRQEGVDSAARSSIILESDLEALRQKVDRTRARKEDVGEKVKMARASVVECYRSVVFVCFCVRTFRRSFGLLLLALAEKKNTRGSSWENGRSLRVSTYNSVVG